MSRSTKNALTRSGDYSDDLTLIVSRELIITWVTSNVRAIGPNYRSDVVESMVEYKSASLAVDYKNRKQQFPAQTLKDKYCI